jgi:predicted nucleic acid-binding protein
MTVVVDASVAVRWTIEMPLSTEAERLLRSRVPLIAPEWIVAEVSNALYFTIKDRRDRVQRALDGLEFLPRWFAELVPATGLRYQAMACALELGHSVYDCFYLALAELRGCKLVTTDDAFLRKLEGTTHRPYAVHLAKWQP